MTDPERPPTPPIQSEQTITKAPPSTKAHTTYFRIRGNFWEYDPIPHHYFTARVLDKPKCVHIFRNLDPAPPKKAPRKSHHILGIAIIWGPSCEMLPLPLVVATCGCGLKRKGGGRGDGAKVPTREAFPRVVPANCNGEFSSPGGKDGQVHRNSRQYCFFCGYLRTHSAFPPTDHQKQ